MCSDSENPCSSSTSGPSAGPASKASRTRPGPISILRKLGIRDPPSAILCLMTFALAFEYESFGCTSLISCPDDAGDAILPQAVGGGMRVSRRTLVSGGGAVAIAAAVPARRTSAQPALYVRQSIAVLMREQSPRIASFRRGVDAMMRLPTWDKRNWWFQANMHGVAADQIPPEMAGSAERYFSKCPHRTYFFLAWNRMYVYFFERILRALSGDPRLTLPYWAYDDPQQLRLPPAFLPDADELETGSPAAANPYARRNPLARAIRPSALDRGVAGLRPDLARQLGEAMALATFATTNRAEANQAFGGARV